MHCIARMGNVCCVRGTGDVNTENKEKRFWGIMQEASLFVSCFIHSSSNDILVMCLYVN